jgi:hypothetical protein
VFGSQPTTLSSFSSSPAAWAFFKKNFFKFMLLFFASQLFETLTGFFSIHSSYLVKFWVSDFALILSLIASFLYLSVLLENIKLGSKEESKQTVVVA